MTAVRELLHASRYDEVLSQGAALLDSLARTQPASPLLEAQLLDLMVTAGYRGPLVMEPRFLEMARRSLALNQENTGPRSLPTATSHMHLANLLLQRGDLAQAIPEFETSISILAELGPAQDQQRAVLLASEGSALRRMGALKKALARLQQALAIQEVVLGPDHADVASTLNNLATVTDNMGHYRQAREYSQRALAIREAIFGPNHEWVAESLHNLANADTDLGAYDEALAVQERAVAIFRAQLGEHHQRYLWAQLNLGLSYLDMGDFAGATPICEEVLAAQQEIYGPGQIDITYALDALGSARFKAGRFAEALENYTRSLAIQESALGVDNPGNSETMLELGRCQMALGDLSAGAATLKRCLAIQEADAGPDSPTLSPVLQSLAEIYLRQSQPAAALKSACRSGRLLAEAVGTEHPSYARSTLLEARALAALGETDQAIETAITAEGISRRHLQITMRALSEARALDYATSRVQGLDLALSLLKTGESSARTARVWDAIIRSRAVVLDEFTARNMTIATQPGTAIATLVDSSLAEREYLANLSLRGPGYRDDNDYRQILIDSRRKLDRLEREISLVDARLGRDRKARELGQDAVRAHLEPGTALVSYVVYRRPVGDPELAHQEDHVMAFVATGATGATDQPVAIELGPAADITSLVGSWRNQVRFGRPSAQPTLAQQDRGLVQVASGPEHNLAACQAAGSALRQAVWDPLQPAVADARQVFIVPAGVLHRVNFAALPTAAGAFMAEDGPLLHTLMTERSIVQLADRTATHPGVLAIGDPDFGAVEGTSRPDTSRCTGLRNVQFDPLPYSRQEVTRLARIWNNFADGGEVTVLTGKAATKNAFKSRLGRYGILHLATHGFVLDHSRRQSGTEADALSLTGLALQGANAWARSEAHHNDGILTASEIAALDMSGVDWAVLSACDTGLGDLTARGEGVFGLCRAFAIAGARTVVVSLWRVEDEAARDWMQALYTAHLSDGLSTEQAVRAADRAVLADRRARGLSVHPYYWAGFTALGGWQ